MYDRLQGVLPSPIGEGTHFRVPWFQTPNVMDIRTRPRSISSVTGTKGPNTSRAAPAGTRCTRLNPSTVMQPPQQHYDRGGHSVSYHLTYANCAFPFDFCFCDVRRTLPWTTCTMRAEFCLPYRSADGEHHAARAVKAGCGDVAAHLQGESSIDFLVLLLICTLDARDAPCVDGRLPRGSPQHVSVMVDTAMNLLAAICMGICISGMLLRRTSAQTGTSECCRPSATRS